MNFNMQISYKLIEYARNTPKSNLFLYYKFLFKWIWICTWAPHFWICRNLHLWQIHWSNHPTVNDDGNAAFRLTSNLKTAWQGHPGTHTPPHRDKVATTGEGFLATAKLLRWKSDVWPAWSEILANYKKRSSFGVWQNYFKELECLESVSIWFFICLLCESESFSW